MAIMEHEDEGIVEPGTAPEQMSGRSILDEIKERREQRDVTLKIGIPTWNDELRAEYRVVDRREIDKLVRRTRAAQQKGRSDTGVEADADFLVDACVGIYAYDLESDTEQRIADGFTMEFVSILQPTYPKGHAQEGEPVRIDHPRELVAYMMAWNSIAIGGHAQRVAKWMQDQKRPVEDPQ